MKILGALVGAVFSVTLILVVLWVLWHLVLFLLPFILWAVVIVVAGAIVLGLIALASRTALAICWGITNSLGLTKGRR